MDGPNPIIRDAEGNSEQLRTRIREMEAQSRRLTALRAAFLVASHHGIALRPEDLPELTDGDMAPSVSAAACTIIHADVAPGSWWPTLRGPR